MIDYNSRTVQVLGQVKFEFLSHCRVLKPVIARARPIGRTLATFEMKVGQTPVVSNFQDVFSEKYGLPPERSF